MPPAEAESTPGAAGALQTGRSRSSISGRENPGCEAREEGAWGTGAAGNEKGSVPETWLGERTRDLNE